MDWRCRPRVSLYPCAFCRDSRRYRADRQQGLAVRRRAGLARANIRDKLPWRGLSRPPASDRSPLSKPRVPGPIAGKGILVAEIRWTLLAKAARRVRVRRV